MLFIIHICILPVQQINEFRFCRYYGGVNLRKLLRNGFIERCNPRTNPKKGREALTRALITAFS